LIRRLSSGEPTDSHQGNDASNLPLYSENVSGNWPGAFGMGAGANGLHATSMTMHKTEK
jgi:hypothetical protein